MKNPALSNQIWNFNATSIDNELTTNIDTVSTSTASITINNIIYTVTEQAKLYLH